MGFKISKNFFYQVLFALCIGVAYLDIYELTFSVWLFAFLISIRKKYSLTIVKYIACFAAIFAIALFVSFFREFRVYNFFRDISYLVKPILGLLVGYQLCRNLQIKPFYTIIYTGLMIAIIHMIIIFFSAIQHNILNVHELRHFAGYFSDFEIYALVVLVFSKAFEIELSPQKKWLIIAVIGVSSFLYLSRTNFIQFIILYLALKGYFKITKRALIVMTMVVLSSLAGYAIIYNMTLTRNGRGLEAFLYKIKNAPIEAFKTKVDQYDWQDFNDNYRSFETQTTIKQVSYEGTQSVLFGKGMGATIDIGRPMWSNDGGFIRYIPTLHNGFMTVFLKAGIIGVLFNLLFIFYLSRQKKSDILMVKNINLLFVGTAIFLLIANWVLLGLYLKIDNKAIVIGFILCYKEMLIKQQRLNISTNENL